MTSSGSAWFWAALLPGLLFAAPAASVAPERLSADVASRLAASWRVAPGQVRVEWNLGGERLGAGLIVERILGRGRDGWFAVVMRDGEGQPLCRRVRAGVEERVMVAARDLVAGSLLGAGDLREERRIRWGAARARDGAPLPGPGWEVRRPIGAGEVAGSPAVRPPLAVQAGQLVDVQWNHRTVRVSARGVALNSARTGESVRVQVSGREQPLFGRVTEEGFAILEEEPR